jgi:hypothetical protein
VIGGTDAKDAVVIREAIKLVEEEGPILIVDLLLNVTC